MPLKIILSILALVVASVLFIAGKIKDSGEENALLISSECPYSLDTPLEVLQTAKIPEPDEDGYVKVAICSKEHFLISKNLDSWRYTGQTNKYKWYKRHKLKKPELPF